MFIFQESFGVIFLNDGAATFQCPLSEFVVYEPEYLSLVSPYIVRYWDSARQYVSDGSSARGDAYYTADRMSSRTPRSQSSMRS